MSWLGWVIAAVVLCPLWWRVAREADKLRRTDVPGLGGLPPALYSAAFATAVLIALAALAAIYAASGAHVPDDVSLGLI